MRIFSFLTNHWRYVYTIGLTSCLLYVFMGFVGEPSKHADTIIYIQLILREQGVIFALPALIILILGVGLYYLKYRELNDRTFLMLIVPSLLVLIVLLLVSQPAIGDQRLFHKSSVAVTGHVYNLAGHHLGQLVVYECDSWSITCRAIYRGVDLVTLEYREECFVPPYFLVDKQTISLIIQCETVFSHPLIQ